MFRTIRALPIVQSVPGVAIVETGGGGAYPSAAAVHTVNTLRQSMLLGFTDVRNPVLVIKDICLRAPGETSGARFRNMRLEYVRLISRRCILLQFPSHVINPQHDRGPLSIS